MKKVFALLLAVVLLIGCCACSDSNTDIRGEITPNLPDIELPSPEAPEIVATEPATEQVTEPATEPATEPEMEFSLGSAAGGTYYNEYLGLRCTLPEEWVFYTDDQILEMNNLTDELLDEEIAQQLESAAVIYDMFASTEAGDSINVNLEKINPIQMINLDIKAVLESQIEVVTTAYEQMGYTDVKAEYQVVTVDGQEFDGLVITANMMGVEVYVVTFAYAKGNYLTSVGVFSLSVDTVNEILGYITVE